jgi:hypothetical protein
VSPACSDAPETWAQLERDWWRKARQDVQPGCIGWVPYPFTRFLNLLHLAMGYSKGPYLELGAGIGTKCLAAEVMGLEARGIENCADYLAEAQRLTAPVELGDVRTTDVSGAGIVFLNHPLSDAQAEIDLELAVQAQLAPGAVLITVNSLAAPVRGAHWVVIARPMHYDLVVMKHDAR